MPANRSKTRNRLGQFNPGQSGNPSGRPRRTREELRLVEACKAMTPEALDVLEHIMLNGENERNRLSAALAIIERAYGKPVQPVSGDAASAPIMHEVRLVPLTAALEIAGRVQAE